MNNKNTMLLTVIAVATLLVAVVGATFAYFTVNNASGTAKTTVTATAEKVGTVTLDGTKTLKLNVTAQEMAEANKKTYYAVESTDPKGNSTDATPIVIATASIDEPGESSYTCTATFTVAASGGMASVLAEGDAKVKLSGAATDEFDLSESQLESKSTAVATFHLSKGQTSETLSALVSLTNTDQIQNSLAGQELNINISAETITCTIDNA